MQPACRRLGQNTSISRLSHPTRDQPGSQDRKHPKSTRRDSNSKKLPHGTSQQKKTSRKRSHAYINCEMLSHSNSLIAFSDRDSSHTVSHPKKTVCSYFFNPQQAVVIIQKTWRGYRTRKLLDSYIREHEPKLNEVLCEIRSGFNTQAPSLSSSRNTPSKTPLNSPQRSICSEGLQLSKISSLASDIVAIDELEIESDWLRKKGVTYFEGATITKKCPNKENLFWPNGKQIQAIAQGFSSKACRKRQDTKHIQVDNKRKPLKTDGKMNIFRTVNLITNPELPSIQQAIALLRVSVSDELRHIVSQQKAVVKSKELSFDGMKKLNEHTKLSFERVENILNNLSEDINELVRSAADSDFMGRPKSQIMTIISPAMSQAGMEEQQRAILTFLEELEKEVQEAEYQTELEGLCDALHRYSEQHNQSMIDRCFMQFLIDIISLGYPLAAFVDQLSDPFDISRKDANQVTKLISKWIDDLRKWNLGPIQEVTQIMESSSFIQTEHSEPLKPMR